MKIQAKELTGGHIGVTVRFLLVDKNKRIEWIITGDLLSVSHGEGVVRVELGSKYSQGRLSEQLTPEQPVHLNPGLNTVPDISELRVR